MVFEEFATVESFFSDPMNSGDLGIFVVSKLSGTQKIAEVLDVNAKQVMLPHKKGFVVMPQMHYSDC